MGVNELEELKKQIKELHEKGFIRPCSLPWGAPVIFVDKKDDTQRMCVDHIATFFVSTPSVLSINITGAS